MRFFKNTFYKALGIKSKRTKNIGKHVILSLFYKIGSIVVNFLLVPLTIDYLDTENYGIWLTVTSFIAWFTFFDIGLGHGLRNKFAEAKANNNNLAIKGYVSTAYFVISAISLVFLILVLCVNYYIDWTNVFNCCDELQGQLKILMPIVFGCFSLQLVVKLITTIYTADQKPSIQGKLNFIIAFSSLILIWILLKTSKGSLLIFGSLFSFLPVLVLLITNVYAFNTTYKDFKPEWKFFKKVYFNDIFGLGLSFFVIQLSGIVLFSTDNIIITQLFDPKEVVPYNISYKYLSISLMAYNIIITPYWSSFTEAYIKQEFEWIKQALKNLIIISLGIVFLILFLVLISSYFYKFWLGDMVLMPLNLTVYMAVFTSISVLYYPFNYFINGTGKVKLQMYLFITTAIINIPLSIFLVKYINFGVEGVILATIICVIPNLIFLPIQSDKLINRRAKGVWGK